MMKVYAFRSYYWKFLQKMPQKYMFASRDSTWKWRALVCSAGYDLQADGKQNIFSLLAVYSLKIYRVNMQGKERSNYLIVVSLKTMYRISYYIVNSCCYKHFFFYFILCLIISVSDVNAKSSSIGNTATKKFHEFYRNN